jgi:copper(I)-binding protein
MIFALALSLALVGAAEAKDVSKGALRLSDLQIRATPAGLPTSAAYLTISNAGKAPDKLLSIECACAASAMMHESRTRNGISSMSMLNQVVVPAGGKVRFKPDGLHVMLVGLKRPLKAGSTQEMTLRFEKAGTVRAVFPVKDVISAH